MKNYDAKREAAGLRREIQLIENRKLEVVNAVESLRNQYYQGLLGYEDYKERINRSLQGLTPRQTLDKYNEQIRSCKEKISRLESVRSGVQLNGNVLVVVLLLVAALSSVLILANAKYDLFGLDSPVGFVVKDVTNDSLLNITEIVPKPENNISIKDSGEPVINETLNNMTESVLAQEKNISKESENVTVEENKTKSEDKKKYSIDNATIPEVPEFVKSNKSIKEIVDEVGISVPVEKIVSIDRLSFAADEITVKGKDLKTLVIHKPIIYGKSFGEAIPLVEKDDFTYAASLEDTAVELEFDSPEIKNDKLGRKFRQSKILGDPSWKIGYNYLLPAGDFNATVRFSSSTPINVEDKYYGRFVTGKFTLDFGAERENGFNIEIEQVHSNIVYISLIKNYTDAGLKPNDEVFIDPTLSISSLVYLCGEVIDYDKIEVMSNGILGICNRTATNPTGYVNITLDNGIEGNFTVHPSGRIGGGGAGGRAGAGEVTAATCSTRGENNTGQTGAAGCVANWGGGSGTQRASTGDSAGGGGGGFGGAGGRGGRSAADEGYVPSNVTGSADDTYLFMGAGGGGSNGDNPAAAGGPGGGGIKISAGAGWIGIRGILNVSGQNGSNGDGTDNSGGGGGSGGHVILSAKTILMDSNTKIFAHGSGGGIAGGTGDACGGGSGGGGRVLFIYESLSNTSSFVSIYGGVAQLANSDAACDAASDPGDPEAGGIGSVLYNSTTTTFADYPRPLLNNPTDNEVIVAKSSVNISFNFTPMIGDNNFKSATIYADWNKGVFGANNTNRTALTSGSNTIINVSGIANGTWTWNVYICDEANNCRFNSTNYTLVFNNAPNITNVSILPADTNTSDTLLANISGLFDFDGDNMVEVNNVSYNWYVNQTPLLLLNMPFTNHIYSKDNFTTFDFSDNVLAGTVYAAKQGTYGSGLPKYTTDNCTIGGCYRFNGTNYINISDPLNKTLGMRDWSILFWYDAEQSRVIDEIALGSWNVVYSRREGINDAAFIGLEVQVGRDYLSGGNAANFIVFVYYRNRTLSGDNLKFRDTSAANKTRFIAILRDGDTGNTSVLFNGTSIDSQSGIFGPLVNNITTLYSTLGIPSISGSGGRGLNGTIDEFQIYNRTLSVEEVYQIYNNGKGNYSLMVQEETAVDEVWNVTAVPVDKTGANGSMVRSTSVTIISTDPPTVNLNYPISIIPGTKPTIIDPRFNISFNFTPTAGGNSLKNATIWGNWSNGVQKPNATNIYSLENNAPSYINVSGIPNGTWSWTVYVCDTAHRCAYNTSNVTFVANNAPNISIVKILPSDISVGDNLTANLTKLVDEDGNYQVNHNNISYNWYNNQTSITLLNVPFTNPIYSKDNFSTFDFSGYNHNLSSYDLAWDASTGAQYTNENCTIGGCYRFNGSIDSFLQIRNITGVGAPNELLGMVNWSMIFWYDPEGKVRDNVDGNERIIYDASGGTPTGYSPRVATLLNSPQLQIKVYITNTSLDQFSATFSSNPQLGNPQKKFIAVIRNGNTGNVTVIFNGTQSTSSSASYGPMVNATWLDGSVITIGGKSGGTNDDINGTLDEFMIFNRTLTPEQVYEFYNNHIGNYSKIVNQELKAGEIWNVTAVPIDNDGLNGSMIRSANITIPTAAQPTAISCIWSDAALNISFGEGLSQSLSQGVIYNASKNFEGYIGGSNQNVGINWTHYNVTADSTNTAPVNITIKGDHLLSGSNVLGITNITWMTNETNGNATDVSGELWNFTYLGKNVKDSNFEGFNLTLIKDGDPKLAVRNRNFSNQLTAGSSMWYRFWLHVPTAQIQGSYVGNYTMECSAAS